jgi:hypothetical protein
MPDGLSAGHGNEMLESRMTGNGHVRFGGRPPQKYRPGNRRQLGGGPPNYWQPEIDRTIRSGLQEGLRRPRVAPHRLQTRP